MGACSSSTEDIVPLEEDAIKAWLERKEFAPGDVRGEADLDPENPDLGSTFPMSLACEEGQINVCKWLYDNGAAEDITKVSSKGNSPMLRACHFGQLAICQWLFEVGAVDDITKANTAGVTPMFFACYGGHLPVCKWLFEVGAAGDIAKANDAGDTPMHNACVRGHESLCQWLVLNGALNDPISERVDKAKVHRDQYHYVCPDRHPNLLSWAKDVVAVHDIFLNVVLRASVVLPNCRMSPRRRCLLPLLSTSQLQYIGVFLGVETGRQLRNVREFAEVVEVALSPTGFLTTRTRELNEVLEYIWGERDKGFTDFPFFHISNGMGRTSAAEKAHLRELIHYLLKEERLQESPLWGDEAIDGEEAYKAGIW